MKREPMFASGSASWTPSGVEMTRRSSYSMAQMMTSPERFVAERGRRGRSSTRRSGAPGTGRRSSAPGVRRLGELYRATAADLAFARRSFPGEPLVARLEALVLRARAAVYSRRAAGLAVALPVAGILGPAGRAAAAAGRGLAAAARARGAGRGLGRVDAPAAAGLIPADFQSAADPPVEGRDFDSATASAFSFGVMANNIQVTLLAFAGGITFGLLTVYALFFNGLLLGTIAGIAIGAGNGVAFLRLVSSHGPLEISCIVVGGVAGLRMGWALVRPGTLRRATSLRRAALPAVEIAAGTVPWLVLCGFLEGFATGPELPVALQTALGFALFALFWGLVLVRGRQSTARDFARR